MFAQLATDPLPLVVVNLFAGWRSIPIGICLAKSLSNQLKRFSWT